MIENSFDVYLGDVIAAKDMSLDVALILVEGMFNKYYLEDNLKITVQKARTSRTINDPNL